MALVVQTNTASMFAQSQLAKTQAATCAGALMNLDRHIGKILEADLENETRISQIH